MQSKPGTNELTSLVPDLDWIFINMINYSIKDTSTSTIAFRST